MDRAQCRSLVSEQVENSRDELIALTQQLVRIPSVVGDEGEAQQYVERLYRDLGLGVDVFEADRRELEQHPAYIKVDWPYAGRPNVVGKLAGDPSAKSLILNGHIDVVSPEPASAWTHDPWGGEVADGKIWGRGAADMKSGLAANYFALKSLLACGLRPKGSVVLQSVIEEEAGGGGGTLACFMRGYRAGGIICTEPQAFRVVISHLGVNYFRVRLEGKPIHAGRAHLGVNAVGKMLKIYDSLVALDEARAARIRYPLFEKRDGRSCNLSIGTFHAGDWPSTVAGSATMEGRLSFVPGERMVDVQGEVEKTIRSVAQQDEWLREHPPTVEWFGWHAEPWEQSPDDPFIRVFADTTRDVLGIEPDIAGLTAGLDARFGAYFDTPGLAFGPTGGNIHGVDEWVEIESIVQATKVLACAIIDWCGADTV
jgi:acetylornithine deacetylase